MLKTRSKVSSRQSVPSFPSHQVLPPNKLAMRPEIFFALTAGRDVRKRLIDKRVYI